MHPDAYVVIIKQNIGTPVLSLTDNRESGVNPERSGHCKRKRRLQKPLHVELCEKV